MALTEAIKEALWLRGLFGELMLEIGPSVVFCDSQSAIYLSNDSMFHDRSKHISVKYHFIRNVIEDGDLTVKKVDSKDNPADILTKCLPMAKFKYCLDLVDINMG